MKDRHPEVTEALENAVNEVDMDGVIYRLVELAVRRRDSEEAGPKPNKAMVAYWQSLIGILHDTEEKISSL